LLTGTVTVWLPSTEWADVVCPTKDPCVALAEPEGTVFSSDTACYIRGEPVSTDLNGASVSGTVATRNLLYEFNSMQKRFGCLKNGWEIAGNVK